MSWRPVLVCSAVLPFHMGEIKLIKFYCKHFALGHGGIKEGSLLAPLTHYGA